MLYVLGNVRISQNELDEAYSLHKRALITWRKTYGEEHHKTGDAWHKKAWHEARLGKLEEARYVTTYAVISAKAKPEQRRSAKGVECVPKRFRQGFS